MDWDQRVRGLTKYFWWKPGSPGLVKLVQGYHKIEALIKRFTRTGTSKPDLNSIRENTLQILILKKVERKKMVISEWLCNSSVIKINFTLTYGSADISTFLVSVQHDDIKLNILSTKAFEHGILRILFTSNSRHLDIQELVSSSTKYSSTLNLSKFLFWYSNCLFNHVLCSYRFITYTIHA